ncbi:MAG: hypothetical protein WCH01_07190 [Methylococcaceae bacterium]
MDIQNYCNPISPGENQSSRVEFRFLQPNDHEDAFITPENEKYCAGGGRARSIKLLGHAVPGSV